MRDWDHIATTNKLAVDTHTDTHTSGGCSILQPVACFKPKYLCADNCEMMTPENIFWWLDNAGSKIIVDLHFL